MSEVRGEQRVQAQLTAGEVRRATDEARAAMLADDRRKPIAVQISVAEQEHHAQLRARSYALAVARGHIIRT